MHKQAQSGLQVGPIRGTDGHDVWRQQVDGAAAIHLEQVATVETALYAVAVLLGVVLRFLLIDQRPLSVEEGRLASQSYRIMLDQMPNALIDGPLPSYGTALTLFLFGGGDGAARLFSAVAGSVLVITPFLARRSVGRMPALLAAFGFALSPLLIFASRTVGTGIAPATLSVLLWWILSADTKVTKSRGTWRPYEAALILSGLIACGPAGISSIVAIGVAAVLSHPNPTSLAGSLRQAAGEPAWRRAALLFAGVTIAISAALGANLSGIQSALVDVWATWLGSWSLSSARGGLLLTIALYELPVLLVALGSLIATIVHRERTGMFLSLWMMILLLLGMLQSPGNLSSVILPLVTMYLLTTRTVASMFPFKHGPRVGWRLAVPSIGVAVPLLVAIVMLNRASILDQEIPAAFIYGEAALVLCGAALVLVMLDGSGRVALFGGAATVLGILFVVHTTAFLNYRMESASRELVGGEEITPSLREAALEASYYSKYFDTAVSVDPQLRGATEWYLRDAQGVNYSTANGQGISIQVAQTGRTASTPTTARFAGLFSPSVDSGSYSWKDVWSWLVARKGLVRPNQRDILLRAPAGDW